MPQTGFKPIDIQSTPIYAIPGLGTDYRIFNRLDLPQFISLEWLTPRKGELLSDYSYRMAQQITQPDPILIGLSFGGIIAQEMATWMDVSHLILISTIVSPEERSWQLNLMRQLPLYQLSKGTWRIRLLPYWARWYGITDSSEIALLQSMFTRFSDTYRMWAIKKVITWEGLSRPLSIPVLRLHGSRDPLFPLKRIQRSATIVIEGGDHFMVYRKAPQVTHQIRDWLFELPP